MKKCTNVTLHLNCEVFCYTDDETMKMKKVTSTFILPDYVSNTPHAV